AHGGLAWRGYFPVGAELTSGKPDVKEGLYFGEELSVNHPLVKKQTPLHGPNLFPEEVKGLKPLVLAYIKSMTELGQKLMAGLSLSLGKPESYFYDHFTKDPLVLFRIFNYPPPKDANGWGVGEHT